MTRLPANVVISSQATIRDAIAAIEANGREVVLVQGEDGRVLGLITDGDIRRGLLANLTLESAAAAVMTRDFFAVPPEFDRAAVLDLMRARSFRHIPVLDEERRLVAIHFLRDLIGATPKPNLAVVMAGGRGTRLRPITDMLPKPMVEVAGRPLIERLLLHLVGHGITQIYIAVNYLADAIERHCGDGASFGCAIRYLRETQPLGTGGALSLLPERPPNPIFVLNADQIMRADLTLMLDRHVSSGYAATVAVGTFSVPIPYATVRECEGRLVALDEKPTLDLVVNRGIYILNPELVDLVPREREFPITDLFTMLLDARYPIGIFHFEDYWLDIGRPSDLNQANGTS